MKLGKRSSKTEAQRAPTPPKREGSKAGKFAHKKRGKFTIILGDEGAILVYMQGKTVVRRLFAPSPQPDHTSSMVELMRSNPQAPLTIFIDVHDQQYVRHSFPPVSSLSVSGLVKRRLERDFQPEDLTGSMALGRDKTGRREWNYLLIALANTALLQQWIGLIVELPNELKGLYLVPVEAQNYIPALKKNLGGPNTPWQLLVSHNKVSGFRQVVLRDGKLVFTRVTQTTDEGVAAVIAGNIEQEIIGSVEYLRRLGFQENKTLEIIVITAAEVKETLDIGRFQAGATHVLTPLDVADMLELQQAALSADRFGDVVMAAWFGSTKKHTLRLMTAYAENLAKLYTARKAVLAAGVLLVLIMGGMSIMNVVNSLSTNAQTAKVEAEHKPLLSQSVALKKSINGLDKDVAFTAAAVGVYDAYMKGAPEPLDFIRQLAALVTPEHRISALTWAPAGAGAAAGAGSGGASVTPAGAPGATTLMEIKVTVQMAGTYADVETLTRDADAYIEEIKKVMVDYDVTAGDYAWMRGDGQSMEIDFNQTPAALGSGTDLQSRQIELVFLGPKAKTDAAAPAGGTPGGAPSGMMPGGAP